MGYMGFSVVDNLSCEHIKADITHQSEIRDTAPYIVNSLFPFQMNANILQRNRALAVYER